MGLIARLQERLLGVAPWDAGQITDVWFRAHFEYAADVVNHWVPKAAITASLVNGEPARALCGSTEVLSSQGSGSVAAAGARTCPRCQSIYDRLLP